MNRQVTPTVLRG